MSTTASDEPAPQPIATTTTEALTEALAVALGDGLPLTEAQAPELLLNLRSVYARSVVPSEPRSRLQALNELLPRLIASLNDPTYREALQILFGLAPGTRDTKLMARRRQAAGVMGYNATHLRTDIEPKLVRAVAAVVHDDLLRYSPRVKRATGSLEPTGDTPRLGPEHLNHEEELVSRIWQHVYWLRAETIAVLRLSEEESLGGQVEDHRQAALRAESGLKELIREYGETYGQQLIRHGEVEFAVESLERLAAWER
jgi:hypothetical protein